MGQNNTVNGIIHILLGAFFFSLMTVFVRLAGDIPTMQKAFFRNFIAAGIAIYLLARSKQKFSIQKKSLPSLILRSIFGTLGILCNFWAVDHLGIADANMLNKMSPFFAIIMSIWILDEKPTLFELGCVGIAFLGALLVIKPTAGMASFPALVGLIGGFAAGTAYTYVRKLGKAGERGPVIVLFFSLFSTIATLPSMLLSYTPMTAHQWLILLLAGISAAGGQLNITAAYTYAPASKISVYDYTQILFAAVLGWLLFNEWPDRWSLVGYLVIVSVAVWKYHRAQQMQAETQTQKENA